MLNQISIMGRLTRDPELKTTPAGKSVCTITLAVERDFADPNGVREADFIDVVCWGRTAEFVSRYYNKGLLVAVTGRLQSRRWKDKHGQNRVTFEVVADQCYFAERTEGAGRTQEKQAMPRAAGAGSGAAGTARGWNPAAADISGPEYAGDLYSGVTERDRIFAAYNAQSGALPQSDYFGMDDEDDVPF